MGRGEAGRTLDAEISRVVFGLVPCSDPLGRCEGAKTTPIQCWGTVGAGSESPPYSTDIAAAMTVFEAMVEMTGAGSINADMEDARGGGFIVSVDFGFEGEGATGPLPLAICRAALAVMAASR